MDLQAGQLVSSRMLAPQERTGKSTRTSIVSVTTLTWLVGIVFVFYICYLIKFRPHNNSRRQVLCFLVLVTIQSLRETTTGPSYSQEGALLISNSMSLWLQEYVLYHIHPDGSFHKLIFFAFPPVFSTFLVPPPPKHNKYSGFIDSGKGHGQWLQNIWVLYSISLSQEVGGFGAQRESVGRVSIIKVEGTGSTSFSTTEVG